MATAYETAGARYQAALAEFVDAYASLHAMTDGGGFPAGRLPDLREVRHAEFAPDPPPPDGLSALIAAKKAGR